VETVSWGDAQNFCDKLSALAGETAAGRCYRLPTEAEWEYACRAGSATKYSYGDAEAELGNFAWFTPNSQGKTHPVGQKKPNGWGLHDMHGNAWEWCADLYVSYEAGTVTDPTGAATGSFPVYWGGSWWFHASGCRASCRLRDDPGFRNNARGFRIARTVSSP
jgi:formylglycine-generating enzyme required for sulfatase activity